MAEKLWKGRFEQPTDKLVEDYTASIHFDSRLYRHDIQGSIAHCRMLAECGIIPHEEASLIVQTLGEILRDIERGKIELDSSQEDIHMAIENELTARIGETGGKLHTARSRNDQVALDMRLFMREAISSILDLIGLVQSSLVEMAENHIGVVMPGFTHLQHAQPILFSHHLMAYYEMFGRDFARLRDCLNRTDVMPLGSAALAGTAFSTDMEWTARHLGFSRVIGNSIDAVSDRDYLIEFCSASAILMMHVSRMAEELVIWSSAEFAFIEISDAFCTGSSIMPQKKNPDVPELMRGKTGRVYGNLFALLTVAKGLPLAYNRDLQEDKEPVFDSVDTVMATLRLLSKMLPQIRINTERMARMAGQGFTAATDLADYLARRDVPFRKAHHVAGRIVQYCIQAGKELGDCSLDELKSFHKAFDEDVFAYLDVSSIIDRRESVGGTATPRVKEAIARAKAELKSRQPGSKKNIETDE
ncbi:MAG: argininosuccinate lyase [Deltaproteobacteria bacterium]|jgi:argininosuccinate lyase|nr:argininosuccinate lyase [Deltaproteobacteria bacterium]MDA8307814.1 argininosuccinate lyase [Deltaproteobacteria bacterium]